MLRGEKFDKVHLPPPPQNLEPSTEILKRAVEDCFKEVNKKQIFSANMLKSYMEPAFIQEGYRDDFHGQENILVIRLDEIGDNALTSGFLRELRKNYPTAFITLIVSPTVIPLVELCPYVNEVIGFIVEHLPNLTMRFEEILKLCYFKLWKRRYSITFLPRWDLDGNRYAAFLAYLSGARERVGYSSSVTSLRKEYEPYIDELLTMPLISPPNIIHEAARNFYMLQAKNLRVENTYMELWYDKDDYKRMEQFITSFAKERKIIAVTVGSKWLHKTYPPEKMLVALQKIKRPDNCFIFLGGNSEKEFGDFIYENLQDAALNLIGHTTLRETAAALSLASMYIGMDTGTMHMAAALNLPVIEINCAPVTLKSDATSIVDRCAPWQTPSIIVRPKKPLPPCDKMKNTLGGCSEIGKMHCITQIDPNDIVAAYEKLSAVMRNDI